MKLYKRIITYKDGDDTIREEYVPEQETRNSNSLIVCGVCFGLFILFMLIGIII